MVFFKFPLTDVQDAVSMVFSHPLAIPLCFWKTTSTWQWGSFTAFSSNWITHYLKSPKFNGKRSSASLALHTESDPTERSHILMPVFKSKVNTFFSSLLIASANSLTPLMHKSITIRCSLCSGCWESRGNNTAIIKYHPKCGGYLWNVRLAPMLSRRSLQEGRGGKKYMRNIEFLQIILCTHTPPWYGRFTFLWALN